MAVVKNLMVRAGADFSELEKKLQSTEKKIKTAGKNMESAGKTMTAAVTVPVLGAAAASFKLASDMEESLNKVNVAFGKNAKDIQGWSKTTLKSYGIAQGSALDMAALFGDMGTAMGFGTDKAAVMSKSLVGLAGDLASFKNIGIDEAQTALKSIFTGETESLKNLGIVMTQANLNAYALSQGINKTVQEMTQAEQVQLRYAYVMEMTKNAQGDFARTSDGAANQMRIFTESLKELGATFGEVLLPMITPIIAKANEMVQKFGSLDLATRELIVKMALLAAAVGPLLIAIGKMMQFKTVASILATVATSSTAAAGGMTAMRTSMILTLGPIALVAAALGGLLALTYALSKQDPLNNPNMWNNTAEQYIGTSNNLLGKTQKKATTLGMGGSRASDYAYSAGESIQESLAAGISDNVGKVSNAMGGVADSISSDLDILKAKFDLWTVTLGLNANASTKLAKELEYEKAQLGLVNTKVNEAQTAYDAMKNLKGETAAETEKLYLVLLNELKAQADLKNQIDNTNKSMQAQAQIISKGKNNYDPTTGISWSNNADRGNGRHYGAYDYSSITPGMPSFDVGTNYVPHDMIAMIHEGEAVVPEKYNNGEIGGGIIVNVYGSVGVDDIGDQIIRTLRRKGVM